MITIEQIMLAAEIVKASKPEVRTEVMAGFTTYFSIQDPNFSVAEFVFQSWIPEEKE